MDIFSDIYQQLPPFLEQYTHMYEENTTQFGDKIKGKVVPYAALYKELVLPESEGNQDTDDITKKLGSIAAAALLVELRDERKTTVYYLSSSDGKFSWKNTSVDLHEAGLMKITANDHVERSFGGTARQLQYFGCIGLTSAGDVDQVKRNGDLSRGFEKNKIVKIIKGKGKNQNVFID